jgi:hypothetical protein
MHSNEKALTTIRPVPKVPVNGIELPGTGYEHGTRINRTSEGYHGNLGEVEIA